MSSPTLQTVQAFYDERVDGKLADFTGSNPRIEAAVQTIADWAPPDPRRVLEIGCGIGATSWRMARAWPRATVVGADISHVSIDVARTCFARRNLSYQAGPVTPGAFDGRFDLIVLMDVYEHIALEDRAALHATVRALLSKESRLILTVPTVTLQRHDRIRNRAGLQPVDEEVTLGDVMRLAADTDTTLLYYREVGVWEFGDYLHLVLGRFQPLARLALRRPGLSVIRRLTQGTKDFLTGPPAPRFHVSVKERCRLAASWTRRKADGSSR